MPQEGEPSPWHVQTEGVRERAQTQDIKPRWDLNSAPEPACDRGQIPHLSGPYTLHVQNEMFGQENLGCLHFSRIPWLWDAPPPLPDGRALMFAKHQSHLPVGNRPGWKGMCVRAVAKRDRGHRAQTLELSKDVFHPRYSTYQLRGLAQPCWASVSLSGEWQYQPHRAVVEISDAYKKWTTLRGGQQSQSVI